MKFLIQIYCKKFLEDAFYLYLLVWVLGGLIYTVNASSEGPVNTVSSLFICFFGILFLYSYPLDNCLKWALNVPIPKRELIGFNIFFQIFKIVVIGGLYFSIYKALGSFHKNDVYREKVQEAFEKAVQTQNINLVLYDSSIVFGAFVAFLFLLSVLFSTSPKLIMESDKIPFGNWKQYFFKAIKNKHLFIFFFIIIIFLRFMWQYWTSPLFIVCAGINYVIFSFIWSYLNKLKYKKSYNKVVYILGICSFPIIMIFLFKYSSNRYHHAKANSATKIAELSFQKGLGKKLEKKQIFSFLHDPLNKGDIDSLMKMYLRTHGEGKRKKDSRVKDHYRYFNIQKFNLDDLLKKKKDSRGIEAVLGLFPPEEYSFKDVRKVVDYWEKTRHTSAYRLTKILESYNHSSKDILWALSSKNKIWQYIGVGLLEFYPNLYVMPTVVDNILNFDSKNLNAIGRILSNRYCQEISTILLVQLGSKKIKKFPKKKCKRHL